MMKVRGRLTLPTDVDMVEETLKLKERLDADALRDCDGTQMPSELLKLVQKFTQPIIQPAKITNGRRTTRRKYSRNI